MQPASATVRDCVTPWLLKYGVEIDPLLIKFDKGIIFLDIHPLEKQILRPRFPELINLLQRNKIGVVKVL